MPAFYLEMTVHENSRLFINRDLYRPGFGDVDDRRLFLGIGMIVVGVSAAFPDEKTAYGLPKPPRVRVDLDLWFLKPDPVRSESL